MNNNYEEEIEVLDGLDEEENDVIDNNQFDENKLIDDMLTPVSIEEFTGEYEDNSVNNDDTTVAQNIEPEEINEEKIEEIPVVNPVLGDINIVEPSLNQVQTNNQVEESNIESINDDVIPEEYGLGFESSEMTEEIGTLSDTESISTESVPSLESDAIVTEDQKQPEVEENLYEFDFSDEDNNDLGFTGNLQADLSEANEIINSDISNDISSDISIESQNTESNDLVEMPQEVASSEPVEITSMASEEPKFEENNNQELNNDKSAQSSGNEEQVKEVEQEELEENLKLKNKKKKKEKKEHKIKAKTVVFIILVLLLIAAFAVLIPTLLENMI